MVLCGRAAWVAALLASASVASGATVEGSVTVGGRPASRTVVYLEAMGAVPPPAPKAPAVMDQKNLAFVPAVLPVTRGTVVEFINSDDVEHNVFSPSAAAGKFNLGTYGPGATRTITLDEPGDVRVLCNIHMEMEAHILVLDFPYFAVVHGGRYRIADVPAGSYTLKMWKERWLSFARIVKLPATGDLTVDIAAAE
jgi:plastocyanin